MKYFKLKFLTFFLTALLAFGVGWAGEVRDVLDRAFTGVTVTSYTSWYDKTGTSGAVYAGNSAGGNNSIQLRKDTPSAIVTTKSGGKVKSITVTWNSNTQAGRTLNIYCSNTAYTLASFANAITNNSINPIGTIVKGTSTTLSIDNDYSYIAIRSANGALYLEKIEIVWETEGGSSLTPVTLSFPEDSYTATLGQTFNAPTLSVDPEEAASEVVYSSSNTDVATVDASTGAVTLIATGTTTITAAISNSETYNPVTASYTLTVKPDLTNAAILDFTEVDYWTPNLPDSDHKITDEQSFNDGTYTVKITGTTGSYWTSNYMLVGKEGAYIQLPAFNRAVTRIDVEGTNTASSNVKQNIFVGETAVSTETLGKGDHSYDIASNYQAAGNIYTLKVTNGYNTQVKKIIIHFDENSSEVPLISVTPSSVTITDATGEDKTGAISATVKPAGTVNATATDGWSATSSSVTYEGKALHAEGTATFSSTGANDVEANLEYNYTGPLYILGTVNNGGWAPNNYVPMEKGDNGLYTATLTTVAGSEGMSWISFTKRVAENNDQDGWNSIAPYRFVPYSKNGDAWWLTDVTVNQFNDLDFDPNHVDAQPVRMSPGTYDITINANDNTFKIEPYIVTVETPTFNPEAGSYKTFQSVTISCATEGATIHYTVDGSEPTESSPVYGDPISVESKMTIKAIAMKSGMANSAIAEATYNLPQTVATMTEAMGVAANSYFLFTGEAVVTYAGQSTINSNYHYIFIRDKRAENGGGVIYYNTNNNVTVPSVQATNVLKRGWYAQLRPYNSWKEFQKAEFVEASGENAAAAPFDRTGMQLKYDDNVNEYIKIDNVTYNEGNITYAGQNREDVTYTYKVVNHFNVALEEGKHYNIEGVVTRNNNTIEFYPTAATLAKQDPKLAFAEETVNATYGADFTEPELTKPEGVTVKYSSNNTEVAEVNETTGEVTIKKIGNAKITATSVENEYYTVGTASYNIVVSAGTPTFAYSAESKEVVFGTENPELPTLNNPNSLTVTYTSSNPAVATVDADGKVTIKGAGKTTITANGAATGNYGAATASYELTVNKGDAGLSFSASTASAVVGSDFTEPTLSNPNGLTVTYTSSNPEVATVDENGNVTIVGEGTTTITAKITGDANYEDAEVSYELTVAPQPVVAAPTFSLVAGTYGKAQQLIITAESGATILYSTDGSEPTTPYNGAAIDLGQGTTTVKAVATKDGFAKSPVVTATYIIDIPEELPTITPFKGYYQIKNNGNGMYANIAGRKTLNFTDTPADKAGTVIWLETNDKGQVQSIRSQAADLQGYANRAMRYVTEIVELVADKLNADGEGNLLGETGLKKIMEKFNESFDHHLYVEQAGEGWRLYGKTPSMQPVVDFYRENTAQVEAKLPMLESFINSALNKLKEKIGGQSVFTDFSLLDIWEKMGGTLTKPVDEASIMAFYREVLNNKNYVWDFAYQTAMIYVNNLTSHDRWSEVEEYLGEYAQYINKIDQIRPDFKYYVVADGNKPDFISEGNVDIKSNAARTIWTLEDRSTFTVNIPANAEATCDKFQKATTLYTDFAYELPEGVTAYKVTDVVEGTAITEALSGVIPAQTPVLLMAAEAGDKVLTLSTEAGTAVTRNLLVGPDYLINTYKLTTPQVEGIFNMIKEKLGEDFYNTYVKEYEHLMYLNSGTVNNKYFWGLKEEDVKKCTYLDEEDVKDYVVRGLEGNAFVNNKQVKTNKAFLVSEDAQIISLNKRGDVNHDGKVNIKDVTDLIDRLLDPENTVACPICSDFNLSGKVDIKDVTDLIDVLLTAPYAEQEQPSTGSQD